MSRFPSFAFGENRLHGRRLRSAASLAAPEPQPRFRLASTALVYLALLLIGLTTGLSLAAQEPLTFDDPSQEARYKELTHELRCTVCQNQNLADSDAPLAQDLRKEIHKMMTAGRSDAEIKTFLVDRYGDFVLYRPPMQGNTLALWVIPLALLFGGAIVVFFVVRGRNRRLAAQRQGDGS